MRISDWSSDVCSSDLGIYKMIPMTWALMWIGTIALLGLGIPGVFGFAGFYSKDIVVEAAFADHSMHGNFAFTMGVLAAFMTAFYSCRLMFITFPGRPRELGRASGRDRVCQYV